MTDQSTYVVVGQRMKAAREALGMTQCEVGKALGVTGATISRYESAQSRIPIPDLLRIAVVLRSHPSYLLTGQQPSAEEKTMWEVGLLSEADQHLIRQLIDFLTKRGQNITEAA